VFSLRPQHRCDLPGRCRESSQFRQQVVGDPAYALQASKGVSETSSALAVTVQLSVDFIGSIDMGHRPEITAEPTKLGRTLAFAEVRISADDELVARATAVFRMLS